MKILITGSAGFIGFHLAKYLCENNHHVIGLDNFCPGYYDVSLKRERFDLLNTLDNFEGIEGDIHDETLLKQAISQVDYVIHLAAHGSVKYSIENPVEYGYTNELGFLKVLEAIRLYGVNVKHCVYASSSAVYAGNHNTPSKEFDIIAPISLYGSSKIANEITAQVYFHTYKIPLTGLRFFTVYGSFGRPDMAVEQFFRSIIQSNSIKLFNNGKMARDFVYIDDIVQGIVSAMYHIPSSDGQHPIYNLASDKSESLYTLITLMEEISGKKAIIEYYPLQSGDPLNTSADISLAKQNLNYKPMVDLKTGLTKVYEWYQKFPIYYS